MDKTTKGIAIGVAAGIVVAVLLIGVIIPAIRQAQLRGEAERANSMEAATCHVNLRTLQLLQNSYIHENGEPAESYLELINSSVAEHTDGVECPSGHRHYEISIDRRNDEYTISCPYGHGSTTGSISNPSEYTNSWD